jgi:phosphoglycolate phosphatase-like HAD superfamily hydrolase
MPLMHRTEPRAATASEIRAIVGPLEDDVIAHIVELAPTAAEVLDAYTRFRSSASLQHRLEHELHGKAARVLDLLEEANPDTDDREA